MQCRPLFANNSFAIRVKQLRERYSLTHEALQVFMDHAAHNKIISFIWGIADDVLRDLKARANQQQLRADFEAYLDGFSSNVQDILTNFEFRNIIPRLSKPTYSAVGSPRSTTDHRYSLATRARVRAISAAGLLRTTGSKPSSRYRSTCSITPASQLTFGSCPTRRPNRDVAKSN